MSKCKPPQYVQQSPRNLKDFKKWRAHEFMNFMLYFAIPIFENVIDEKYFKHLLLLIIPLEHLLSKHIDKSKLETINLSLNNFVRDLYLLYDQHIMLSGTHELLHLVFCTETIGPLNDSSNFAFEELNGKVTQQIKSQDLVGDEFIKLYNASKNMHLGIRKFDNMECKFTSFIKKNMNFKTSNRKVQLDKDKDYLKLGKKFNVDLDLLNDRIKNFLFTKNIDTINIIFYERIYLNNITYSAYYNEANFANDLVETSNKLGKIIFIFSVDGTFYLLCKSLVLLNENLYHNFNGLKSHYSLYSISSSLFLIDQTKFRFMKKYFYFINEHLCLVNKYTSNHLFS